MKKVLIIICLLLITGCSDIRKQSFEDIINNITVRANKCNVYRTGYNYYLPRGMQVSNSTLYNEAITDANYKYFLYVDMVSYYKKVEEEYQINDNAVVSKKIEYNGKFGYVEVNLLKNNKYDIILMDDMMPKMSGTETLKEIQKNELYDGPVVALTANALTGMKEKYIELGFTDYLAKPIEKAELNRVLKTYLTKK